jgi:hypothetical protein
MTLSRLPEGVAAPFADLPAEKQAELLGWIRSEQERKRLADPVGYFQLQYPDGEPADRDVFEMHLSQAVELNEQKSFGYLASERNRAAKIAEWKARVEAAKKQADSDFKHMKERAEAAAICDLPLPDSKQGWQLLEWRRAHVAEITRPEPRLPPRPDISYGPADALWVRCAGGGNVIRIEGTKRGHHD